MEEPQPAKLVLPPVMDIGRAEALHDELLHIKNTERLELNASDVERITTPCIQLILSAAHTLESAEGELVIINPSAVMVSAFEDLGLQMERYARKQNA